jgi:hypothetical protein
MACRGILRPPYGAARSLLEWGIDLWPYVNGRALVNGLQLASMPATDMLDVLHYFLEDDMNYGTAEQADARDAVRTQIYESMYDTTYKYGKKNTSNSFDASTIKDFDGPEEKMPEPFNPAQKPKRYVAPTAVDADAALPFGNVLDAPLENN